MRKIFCLVVVLLVFVACGRENALVVPDESSGGELIAEDSMSDDIGSNDIGSNDIASGDTASGELPAYVPAPIMGELAVTFEYNAQEGWASNQFAVWVEDILGNHVRTLYVTRWTAAGGFVTRPMSIPAWVESSGAVDMDDLQVDAIAGATPDSGMLSFIWDLTDMEGNPVPAGEYRFFVEANTRWANRLLFEGVVDISGEFSIVWPEVQFIFEGYVEFPALNEIAPENSIIENVTAVFTVN